MLRMDWCNGRKVAQRIADFAHTPAQPRQARVGRLDDVHYHHAARLRAAGKFDISRLFEREADDVAGQHAHLPKYLRRPSIVMQHQDIPYSQRQAQGRTDRTFAQFQQLFPGGIA